MPVPESAFSIARNYGPNRYDSDAYETLSFGRMRGKRRKSEGLNSRLSRMLLHLNTSLVADPSTLGTKRPRIPSHGSSSTTAASEAPQTPIDVIHNSVKSSSLGESFAIIKSGSSPDKGRLGFFASQDLPSWRDGDRQKGTQEKREQALPNWLAQTFASLESDHPLRALAYDDSSSAQEASGSFRDQGPLTVEETPQPGEMHNVSIFAFAPPIATSVAREDTQANSSIDGHGTGFSPSSKFPATHGVGPYNLPSNDLHAEARDDSARFRPFAQPGPFAQKSVHFLTPSKSSPQSASDHATVYPAVLPSNQSDDYMPAYKPFKTPGPAASFQVASFDHEKSNSLGDEYTDSLSFADDIKAEDEALYHTIIDEEDAAASILSFASNSQDKPFTTPGPIYRTPFDEPFYYNSEDHTSFNDAYRNVSLESELPSVHGPKVPSRLSSDTPSAMQDIIREELGNVHSDGMIYPVNLADNDLASSPLHNTASILHEAPDVTNTLAAIELFSSSPYIRFKHPSNLDSQHSNSSANKSAPRRVAPEPDPHYMRLKSLPISSRTAVPQLDRSPGLPCTPHRSQPQLRHLMEFGNTDDAPESGTLDVEFNRSALTNPETPLNHQQPFAHDLGVYASPIRVLQNTTTQATKGAIHNASEGLETSGNADTGIWNISLSQLSDDSIEEWES